MQNSLKGEQTMDYRERLDELNSKMEREELTENEKAEISLLRSKELRELRNSIKRIDELFAQMLENIEKLKNF